MVHDRVIQYVILDCSSAQRDPFDEQSSCPFTSRKTNIQTGPAVGKQITMQWAIGSQFRDGQRNEIQHPHCSP